MFLPLAEKMMLKMINDGGLHTEAGKYDFYACKLVMQNILPVLAIVF